MRDRLSTTGTELVESRAVVATYPEKDFGDGATFRWFIETGARPGPRRLRRCGTGTPGATVCKDDMGGDAIAIDELHAATPAPHPHRHPLAFDACNMGAVDVAYEVAPTGLVRLMISRSRSRRTATPTTRC